MGVYTKAVKGEGLFQQFAVGNREDLGSKDRRVHSAVNGNCSHRNSGMDYKKAGVDIEAGYRSVELMKEHVKKTMRPEVLGGLGAPR